jgi:hypothetical protein
VPRIKLHRLSAASLQTLKEWLIIVKARAALQKSRSLLPKIIEDYISIRDNRRLKIDHRYRLCKYHQCWRRQDRWGMFFAQAATSQQSHQPY